MNRAIAKLAEGIAPYLATSQNSKTILTGATMYSSMNTLMAIMVRDWVVLTKLAGLEL